MRKLYCIALLVALGWVTATAQVDELGLFVGVSNYAGDLTQRHIEPLEFNMAAGFFIRHELNERWALKIHLYRGEISGDDAHSTHESGRWKRNLKFHSEIYELGTQVEYHLANLKSDYYLTAPYVFAGVGGFAFSPRAELKGKTYDLHAFQTEESGYSPFSVALVFGGGWKLALNDHGAIGIELGMRKTFTDYLDDVSGYYPDLQRTAETNPLRTQLSYRSPEVDPAAPPVPPTRTLRGNPDTKDWYFFFGFTLSFFQPDKPGRKSSRRGKKDWK